MLILITLAYDISSTNTIMGKNNLKDWMRLTRVKELKILLENKLKHHTDQNYLK